MAAVKLRMALRRDRTLKDAGSASDAESASTGHE